MGEAKKSEAKDTSLILCILVEAPVRISAASRAIRRLLRIIFLLHSLDNDITVFAFSCTFFLDACDHISSHYMLKNEDALTSVGAICYNKLIYSMGCI